MPNLTLRTKRTFLPLFLLIPVLTFCRHAVCATMGFLSFVIQYCMTYLKLDKTKLVNLEYSLHREVLRTNRAGSYCSTTVIGCNTRKYHGMLVCPVAHFGEGALFCFRRSTCRWCSISRCLIWAYISTRAVTTNPRGTNIWRVTTWR